MAGTLAGRYALDVELARGGMGVVYRGRDLETGEAVAIKVMLPAAMDDPDLVARFEREAQVMARVEHPGLVRLRHAGIDFGRPYMVMDLVEGETLRSALKHTGFGLREATRLMLEVAEALEALHQAGALHRDVKPANVLLDAQRRARLTDLGIVKLLEAGGPQTQTGTILGSANYLAPEQALGDRDQQGPPTDVYGLGATYYELLTGRNPIDGPTPVTILHAVLEKQPTPVRELAPQVPAELAAVCERCLAKDPTERFPTAAALALALRTQLRRLEAPVAAPAEASARPPAAARSGPPAVAWLAGALALAVGLGVGAWRARPAAADAAGGAGASTDDDSVAAVWSALVPQPLHPVGRQRSLPTRQPVSSARQAGSLLGMAAEPAADDVDGRVARARLRWAKGELDGALADFEAALHLDPWHREGLAQVAQLRWERGDPDGAIEDLERLIQVGLPSMQRRVHLVERAYLLLQVGRLDEATAQAQAALHDDGTRSPTAVVVGALAQSVLGGVALRQGRFARARDALEVALDLYPSYRDAQIELLYAYAGLGQEGGPVATRWLEELSRGSLTADDRAWIRGRLDAMGEAARRLDGLGVSRPGAQ